MLLLLVLVVSIIISITIIIISRSSSSSSSMIIVIIITIIIIIMFIINVIIIASIIIIISLYIYIYTHICKTSRRGAGPLVCPDRRAGWTDGDGHLDLTQESNELVCLFKCKQYSPSTWITGHAPRVHRSHIMRDVDCCRATRVWAHVHHAPGTSEHAIELAQIGIEWCQVFTSIHHMSGLRTLSEHARWEQPRVDGSKDGHLRWWNKPSSCLGQAPPS